MNINILIKRRIPSHLVHFEGPRTKSFSGLKKGSEVSLITRGITPIPGVSVRIPRTFIYVNGVTNKKSGFTEKILNKDKHSLYSTDKDISKNGKLYPAIKVCFTLKNKTYEAWIPESYTEEIPQPVIG